VLGMVDVLQVIVLRRILWNSNRCAVHRLIEHSPKDCELSRGRLPSRLAADDDRSIYRTIAVICYGVVFAEVDVDPMALVVGGWLRRDERFDERCRHVLILTDPIPEH